MKSSKTGFSRFLLIVDRTGKNISKLIRRSKQIYTIHTMLFWYYLTENIKVYIDGIWSVTKKPVHLEQVMEKTDRSS